MSTATATKTAQPLAHDLKQGVAYATAATAEASEKAIKSAKDFAAFNQASLKALAQAGQILTAASRRSRVQRPSRSGSSYRPASPARPPAAPCPRAAASPRPASNCFRGRRLR